MPLGAVILEPVSLNPHNVDVMDFSRPMDNGIRIMSPEYLVGTPHVYYGDEIDLKFWHLLGLSFGTSWTTGTVLTLIPDYRYVYNHMAHVFDAYDDTGVNFVHIEDVDSIAGMGIDFTIHKSHQFEIIVDPSSIGLFSFIFPAHIIMPELFYQQQNLISQGVDNIYLADKERPYKEDDEDNPIWDYKHISLLYLNSMKHRVLDFGDVIGGGMYGFRPEALDYFWDINWDRNCPTNYFYLGDRFVNINPEKLLQMFSIKELDPKILLPYLSINVYPDLMPIDRAGETQNNRPVYEPWLIYVIEFLYNKYTKDYYEDIPIPLFDLSPRWE